MRLDSPTPPKKPLRVLPKLRATVRPAPARGVSWWTACARPDQRADFALAARARNAEMRLTAEWSKPAKLEQIGVL